MGELTEDKKFGLVGTSCAGKTTTALKIASQLKEDGYNADLIHNQDRRLPFDREYLDTDIFAQYWCIFNQIAKECEVVVGRPEKIVVTDRTPLDFYAYGQYQYESDRDIWYTIRDWISMTYDTVFYLDPLELEQDGARPDDEFRLGVDAVIQELLEECPNAEMIERKEIYPFIIDEVEK